MSAVTWLCLLAAVLALVAIATGYVAVGVFALALSPVLAWYDWREFGSPPDEAHWWSRFGPPPRDDDGGSKFAAVLRRGPKSPSSTAALPLPEADDS